MIPREELNRYHAIVNEARDLASQGRIMDGYLCLDLGVLWAETPPLNTATWEWEPEEPWADELSACYRAALMAYAEQFSLGLSGEPVGEPEPTQSTTWRRLEQARERTWRLLRQSRGLLEKSQYLRDEARRIREHCRLRRMPAGGSGG